MGNDAKIPDKLHNLSLISGCAKVVHFNGIQALKWRWQASPGMKYPANWLTFEPVQNF